MTKPDPADVVPEAVDTRVTVKAPLPIAGLFARDEVRTVELTPFVEGAISNGKLVVQE